MVLEHFSHQHPLILNTELQNDVQQLTCSGCEEPIRGRTCYSCSSCHYFLHTKCALLPWEIKSQSHRDHPLTLLAKPPSYYSMCVCDLCRKTCRSFVYHCSLCNFDLDIKCAFPPSLPGAGRGDKKMVLEHFSHQHLLLFKEMQDNGGVITCFGCEERILGLNYSCITCDFILHKKCAELPREIKSHLHLQHSLTLIAKPPSSYTRCVCDLCSKTCRSFIYHCSLCNFDLDVNCAIPPCIFEDDLISIEHFSHPHPLKLNEEQKNSGEQVICFGCEKPVSGPSYCCTPCNFTLHKKCAELPKLINSHFHREHPLALLAEPPAYYTSCICDMCRKHCRSFVYHCSICKFDLDIKCAFPLCIYEPESHGHQFICLFKSVSLKSFSFTCEACGTDGDDSPLLCMKCQLVVHNKCISLLRTINIPLRHHHPLNHTSLLQEDAYGNNNSGIGQNEINADYGGYECRGRNFICATGNTIRSTVEDDKPSTSHNTALPDSVEHIIRDIKLGEVEKVPEIKHFSHQHNLLLIEEAGNNKFCDGCMLPISAPCYGCVECNFYLDVACLKLPKQKQFLNGGLQLVLHSQESAADGIYRCSACFQYCNGFVYKCEEIGVNFDVRCCNLVSSTHFKHEGHKHPLFFATGTKDRSCSACNDSGWPFMFSCAVCNFKLDFRCATLPNEARHRYDRHTLFLTYRSLDDGSDELYCDVCERERDPKQWFYSCAECKSFAHPKCILGKNPFVKLGVTYTFGIHCHPLTLVQKRRKFPPCHTCGLPCDDLALECALPQCKFIIHRKKDHCVFPESTNGN